MAFHDCYYVTIVCDSCGRESHEIDVTPDRNDGERGILNLDSAVKDLVARHDWTLRRVTGEVDCFYVEHLCPECSPEVT